MTRLSRTGICATRAVRPISNERRFVADDELLRSCSLCYFGGGGMADEWWSTMSQRSPFLTKVKL